MAPTGHNSTEITDSSATALQATRDILDAIHRHRDDEQPIFDIILQSAARLCDAPLAGLTLANDTGDRLMVKSIWGDLDHRLPVPEDGFALDSDVFPARAFRAAEVLHIGDIKTLPEFVAGDPRYVALVEQHGFNAYLCVPLVMNGAPIGCLDLFRTTPEPFDDAEITLVETFATQAVIAIENVRQFREVQERLEREQASREILHVISKSRDDETPVFKAILERAQRLCEATASGLQLVNEDRTRLRYVIGSGPDQGSFTPGETTWDLDGPYGMCAAVRDARVMHMEDMKNSDLYRSGDPSRVALVDTEGVQTQLHVPLLKDGVAFGNMSLSRREPKPFTPDQIALVETFAAQAVIAIENVRQFREVQERLERERASAEILEVISVSRDDEKPVFDAILRNAATICEADQATLQLVDEARTQFHLAASWGLEKTAFPEGNAWPLAGTQPVPEAILSGRSVNVADFGDTEWYRDGDPIVTQIVDREGVRSRLVIPLKQGSASLGAISLSRRAVRPFAEKDIQVVETFAAQAVIAIENVRQFREVQERLEREQATKEVLQVISNSRDDETPVFTAILEQAARLCGAIRARLLLLEDDGEHLRIVGGWGREAEAMPVGHRLKMHPDYLATEAIREKVPLNIRDMRETKAYRDGLDIPVRNVEEGALSIMMVPLIDGEKAIGCIGMSNDRVGAYDDKDVALVQNFAAQAVIAIENARQFRELQDRLQREAATGEVLGVISTSRDDEQPVFDTILAQACRLCDAPFAFLCLVDPQDNMLRVPATHGGGSTFVDAAKEFETSIDTPLLIGQSTREKRVINVGDLREEQRLRPVNEDARLRTIREEGIRSVLYVPLISDGVGRGCIAIYRRQVQAFSDDEVKLIETFAAQAVIAIENVRQFREVQDRLERERALAEILEVISQSRDDEGPVFKAILERTAHLCQTDLATFNLMNEEGTHLEYAAHFGQTLHTYEVGVDRWSLDSTLQIAESVREGRIVHNVDLRETQLYKDGDRWRRQLADDEGVRSFLTVPLIAAGGKPIGCIGIYRKEVRAFSDDEIALVENFAAQAVIAIENVRQFREVQERLEREKATKEVLSVISKSRADETPVFNKILTLARELCEAEMSTLLLVNPARTALTYVGAAGTEISKLEAGFTIPIDDPMGVATATRTGNVVNNPDLKDDDLYRQGHPVRVRLVDEEGIRSQLAVPLLQGDQPIGVLALNRREQKAFTADEVALIESFAAQAVIAIENVRQFKALETLNTELGDRVDEQVGEIERMGRLKRFLPSAVADAVVTTGDESMLTSHRAMVATLFCDMRGFTAFCEAAEPEETIEVLQTYHQEMSELIDKYGGGVDQRAGDGIMVIFNDPIPVDDPAGDAVRLAIAMREKMRELCAGWKRLGHRLGFGVGISLGYATVGMVGSAGRFDYTASGTAVNTAARLCDMAADGDILISPRVWVAVEGDVPAESRGEVEMKGIREPVEIFAVSS